MAKPGALKDYPEQYIIDLLNQDQTIDKAAHCLKVHPRTLIRWLDKRGYKRTVKIEWMKRHEQPDVDSRILAV